ELLLDGRGDQRAPRTRDARSVCSRVAGGERAEGVGAYGSVYRRLQTHPSGARTARPVSLISGAAVYISYTAITAPVIDAAPRNTAFPARFHEVAQNTGGRHFRVPSAFV